MKEKQKPTEEEIQEEQMLYFQYLQWYYYNKWGMTNEAERVQDRH